MTRALALILLSFLYAAPAAAGVTCLFTQECLEAEPCAEAAFELRFDPPGASSAPRLSGGLVAETDFGPLPGYVVGGAEGTRSYLFEGTGTLYLMTVTGRAARLSAHVADGPVLIGYLGSCLGGA